MLENHQKVCAIILFFLITACSKARPPEVLNYSECLSCHEGIEDIGRSHDFDCKVCHLRPREQQVAFLESHESVVRNPSDPKYVSLFCGRCHQKEIEEITTSLHATAAGIINQTRYLWGAQKAAYPPTYSANNALTPLPEPPPYPDSPETLVDDFLRRKCLRCHIGTQGAKGLGLYRASGCAACHVLYSNDGKYRGNDKAINRDKSGYPIYHRFARYIPTSQCLHCHNQNHVGGDYEGMFEHDYDKAYRSPIVEGSSPPRPYGIEYHHLAKDIHAKKGMWCTDCHTKSEVMGTGMVYGYEGEVPKIQCADCHGGFSRSKPSAGLKNIEREGNAFIFCSQNTGQRFPLSLFSKEVVSHNLKGHEKVRCGACHAQWSYQDYGLSVIREDVPDYRKWRRLMVQGDPYLERFLKQQMGTSETQLPASPDWLDGQLKSGLWYSGWRMRRWEFMPLGMDGKGKYAILRPKYQYFISYVDGNGNVILNNAIPQRGDNKEKGWTFMPYQPHTISPIGRKCEGCHLNEIAANKDIFEVNTRDTRLFLPNPPVIPQMRLLNEKEQKKLMTPTKNYQASRFLDLTTTR